VGSLTINPADSKVNGVIAYANREIRWHLQLCERSRRDHARAMAPFVYLDDLIAELETMHLDGLQAAPRQFLPPLVAVNRLLPAGIEPRWDGRT